MKGLGHQTLDAPARVETAERVLQDHLDAGAQRVGHAGRDGLAVQQDAAALHGFEAQDGAGQRGFAAAGFADQPYGFALEHGQAGPVHGPKAARPAGAQPGAGQGIVAHHVPDFQQGPGAGLGQHQPRLMGGRRQQFAGIALPGTGKEIGRRGGFDQLAAFQHGDVLRQSLDHGQIMGDQEQPHALVPHQPGHQVQDARLGRHVQRGGRLVRDQQVGAQRDGQRDGDALALSARQFVRIERQRKAGTGHAHAVQRQPGLLQRLVAMQAQVQAQRLGDLVADGHQRVQRGHGFLKDHADAPAPDAA